jgi:hypothetical protein
VYPPPQPQPIRTGVPGLLVFVIAGVMFMFGGIIGLGLGVAASSGEVGAPSAAATETVTAKSRAARKSASPAPKPRKTVATSFDDGTYRVGAEIKPGTYKAPGGGGCYWERMRDFEGGLNSIIANESPAGSTTVTIKSGDKGFKTHGCGTWKRL